MGRSNPNTIDVADQSPEAAEKETTATTEMNEGGAMATKGEDAEPDRTVESAAAKKKRKKKEKEREKKAAAKTEGPEPEEAKPADGKKPPRHVREMQEALARRREEDERRMREEEERLRREEEERARLEEVERRAEEARRRRKEREKEKILQKRREGKPVTAKQKEEQRRLDSMRRQFEGRNELNPGVAPAVARPRPIYGANKSKLKNLDAEKPNEDHQVVVETEMAQIEEDGVEDWEAHLDAKNAETDNNANGHEDGHEEVKMKKEVAAKKEVEPSDDTSEKGTVNELRSPICCILGHVDTGKTLLLDCIRGTNVQGDEAGGITQQIGATYIPTANIRERTKELKADATLKVPGLLVIDTPGHESFAKMRSRGSSLCDIAVLVVDIKHGLKPQTVESLNKLKDGKTDFIVALNKVDLLYGWKSCRDAPIMKAMKKQSKDVKNEFNMRLTQIITEFKEQGLNTALYYKNKEMGQTFNIVPTSATSGEGIPDLLLLLIQWAQKTMEKKLTYVDKVECTILEVKVIEGLGTTIDVVLVNGILHEGDQIVVCSMQGPIVTTIRALQTPRPMKELRVKGEYLQHKEIKAAQGVKISAPGLEHAITGTALYVVGQDDDLEDVKDKVMQELKEVMNRIEKSGEGVYVQASTLGSMEALTGYLKGPDVNIPFAGFSIGPVHKKDVTKASVMLVRNKKEYATILAFDVKIMPEARELANETGVRIFEADTIYSLIKQFKAYIDTLRECKKRERAEDAVFPCVLKIMPNCVFNKKDPIILGVEVAEGILKLGTPICVPARDFIDIGKIRSIEINHKQFDKATKGHEVAIKIVGSTPEEQQKMFGRHFEMGDELVSHITRRSIDVLEADYRDELSKEERILVKKLQRIFKIP